MGQMLYCQSLTCNHWLLTCPTIQQIHRHLLRPPYPRPVSSAKRKTQCGSLSDVSITISGRLDVRIGSCEVCTLVTLMKEMEVAL